MKPWTLLGVGLLIGLVGGLIYAWVLSPPEYYDTYPPLMHESYRKDWIQMTTLAYGAEGDWNRMALRLRGLSEAEVRQVTAQMLDKAIAADHPIILLQRVAKLARSYGVNNPAVDIYTQENPGPSLPPSTKPAPLPTPMSTATPVPPPPTPTLTPGPTLPPVSILPTPQLPTPYRIISQTLGCADTPSIAVSLLLSRTVEVRGRERVEQVPQPGRAIWLLWEDGADRAITGFKPEIGPGYADFVIEPGRVYNLYIDTPTGIPVSTLQVAPCTPEEGAGWMARSLIVLEEIE